MNSSQQPSKPWSSKALVTGGLVLAAVLPNLNSLTAYFVGDDFDYLVRVRHMKHAVKAIELAFWGEWEPLWYLSFYLDFKWWGYSPVGYHVTSILWLTLAVLLLYGLVRELLPEAGLAPWAAALLFATHPLHDEAVTYLAARGHPMAAALTLLALWLYARSRRSGPTWRRRTTLLVASLFAAFLATMAKETALLISLCILVLEGCVLSRERLRPAAIGPAVRGGLLFLIPAASHFALRFTIVGFDSHKLRGAGKSLWERLASLGTDLPDYALIGGLPLPFASFSRDGIDTARPLGWLVVGIALVVPAILVAQQLRRDGRVSRALGIYIFGVAVILITLAPVVWADLGMRRRYFFMPSIGTALMAAVVFQWLAARRARLAWGLLAVLVMGGTLGLVQRNELYRQAGEITRNLVETARGAPLGQPAPALPKQRPWIVLTTLPRYLGGDSLSGAYVLHWTDAHAALRVAGNRLRGLSTGLKCYHAEDFRAEATFEREDVLDLNVSFRTRRAYEAARDRDPASDRKDWPRQRAPVVRAGLEATNDEARRLRYRVQLSSVFTNDPNGVLLLYSDGEFRRLAGPGASNHRPVTGHPR